MLDRGHLYAEDLRAAGLPDVVMDALTLRDPGPEAQSLIDEVTEARESLDKY